MIIVTSLTGPQTVAMRAIMTLTGNSGQTILSRAFDEFITPPADKKTARKKKPYTVHGGYPDAAITNKCDSSPFFQWWPAFVALSIAASQSERALWAAHAALACSELAKHARTPAASLGACEGEAGCVGDDLPGKGDNTPFP